MNMSGVLIAFFLLSPTCDKRRPDVSGQAASTLSCCIPSPGQGWKPFMGHSGVGEMERTLGKARIPSLNW